MEGVRALMLTRRRLLAAAAALATATLAGCLGYRTDSEIEYDLSRRVLACLNEDDADGLEALFCEASRARPELRAEIARGTGFFEGRVDLAAGWREGGWSTVSGGGLDVAGGGVLGRGGGGEGRGLPRRRGCRRRCGHGRGGHALGRRPGRGLGTRRRR